MRHRFVWTFDWTWPHIKEMVSVLTVNTLYTIVVHTLPSALRSRAALHRAVKCGSCCTTSCRRLTVTSQLRLFLFVVRGRCFLLLVIPFPVEEHDA